ncbi:MAG: PUA domain-containing protein [Nitrososphaerales archaeon]
MRIYTLSKRDARNLIDKMAKKWPLKLNFSKPQVKIVEIDEHKSLLIFPSFEAIKLDDLIIPFLKNNEILISFPYVEVDRDAIPHICNGSNIMRPGIVGWGTFRKDDIVCVKESNYKKFIAVGIALIDQSDMKEMKKGIVVKNLHYIGDKFWEVYKQIPIQINNTL